MTIIKPFQALRPTQEFAAQVASVPYDVINREEAKELAANNSYSFLRISRSELELEDIDPYSEKVYQHAKDNLKKFEDTGVLFQEKEASFYLYQLVMGEHTQTGIVACFAADDYESGVIKVHEKTRVDKEKDRLTHMLTTQAHAEPVFLVHKNNSELNSLVKKELVQVPLYDFTAVDGIKHKLWKVVETTKLQTLFEKLPSVYIADGHHRAASSNKSCKQMKASNPNHTGKEEYNFFLAVSFPDDQVKILPYNRVIKKLPVNKKVFLASLEKIFDFEPKASPSPIKKGQVSLYMSSKWITLSFKPEQSSANNPIDSLDVSLLQNKVLNPLLGIKDPRTDKNIDFVGGIRGTKELERLVDSAKADCAFSMYPVLIEEVLAIADNGEIMPPKSTWFEPKLRSGLFVHKF